MLTRRLFSTAALVAVAAPAIAGRAAAQSDQTHTLRIAERFGVAFLPLHVLRDQKLVEKHARAQGIEAGTEFVKLSGGASMNDALLSGSIDIGAAGIGPVLTIWDRTRENVDVRAIAALGSLPSFLVTRNPHVKTLRDFTRSDRIALPAITVSVQARTLQIAAEKEFGVGYHKALDAITVSLPHPDATAALLSGVTEITAHFSNPPFQYQALADPRIRRVVSSYDVLGGPATSNLVYATSKFRRDNPKLYAAFLAALTEAIGWIEADKAAAVDTYVRVENSKLDPALIRSILESGDVRYTLAPERTHVYAEFLHRTGALRNKTESWRDYFFEDVGVVAGS